MKIYIASLASVSPYSQSRKYEREFPRHEKESHDDYEVRTWRHRLHVTSDGHVFIPATQFKESLVECAQYLSIQIPGKGKATYTKHVRAGTLISEGIILPIKADDVPGEWLSLDAQPGSGRGGRVWRCMPRIDQWKGDLTIHILDETVTADVLRYFIEQMGAFTGIGRFRPINGGFYGRFRLAELVEVSHPSALAAE
jgi:hypothetical protein